MPPFLRVGKINSGSRRRGSRGRSSGKDRLNSFDAVVSRILKGGPPMMRKLTVCACALVALLLLGSDASAQGCDPVYGGYGYNPGGLGGPYSGLGVRPGLGFGGFGLRR